MKVEYTKDFDKKIDKINDDLAKKRLNLLIEKLKKATTLWEIPHVVPVESAVGLYRIRTGDYRLFVEYWNGKIVVLLIDYRKRNEKTYKGLN
jgi:mRNA-degrading endonuclease RelE of RelBE toxin-antitoxin system